MIENRRYARWLGITSTVAFLALVLAFAGYVTGLIPAAVPIEQVPRLWTHPAREYLAAAGLAPGWGWIAWIHQAEGLNLAAVVALSAATLPALVAVAPIFAARRERMAVVLCVLQAAIIIAAACGVFG